MTRVIVLKVLSDDNSYDNDIYDNNDGDDDDGDEDHEHIFFVLIKR